MPAVQKLWHLVPHDRTAIARLAGELGVSPVVAQLLLNRDLKAPDAARRFLDAPLAGLHPPMALPGMPEAVERLYRAVEAKKKVCVYGDYDADGVTGTAILLGLFQQLGVPAEFYVPHRLDEGYGLKVEALRQLAASGVQVVVTVDCGICSLDEAEAAKELGIELIITDHHEMKDRLPAACCVHPRLPGGTYPFGGLSGAGVAFKLAWALAVRHCGTEKVTDRLRNYLLDALCLATLGLVADVVPLCDENRILVRAGLNRLREKPPVGVQALIESAQLPADRPIRCEDVGFKLAPRLNAAGRLGCARLVVEMLTTSSPQKAREVAGYLDSENGRRQALERKMVTQARDLVERDGLDGSPAVVLTHPDWHAGVVGIVAGRMVEYLGRPVILFAAPQEGSGVLTGSGRSIPGFELHEALKACDDLLVSHGGHAMAAGVRVEPQNLDAFRHRFQEYAARHFPAGTPPAPRLRLDAEVPLSALTPGLLRDLDRLEPYGADNPRPRFLAGGLEIVGDPRRIGKDERHLNFKVRQNGTSMRVVAWGMGDRLDELMSGDRKCCVAFTPRVNEWQGQRTIELEVVDFQPCAEAKLG